MRESCWQRQIIDGQGRVLFILKEYNQPKFKISGWFDKRITDPSYDDFYSIGVSINRDPKAIAADIKRRLLPSYSPAFAEARARYLENEQEPELLDVMVHLIMKASGGRKTLHQWSDAEKAVHFENGTATIYGPSQEVNMDLRRLSIDQALQIAALLNSEHVKTTSNKLNLNHKKEENG